LDTQEVTEKKVMSRQWQRQPKNCWHPQNLEEERKTSSFSLLEKPGPNNTLISSLQMCENKFLMFKPKYIYIFFSLL
jgi:hypothetical protein